MNKERTVRQLNVQEVADLTKRGRELVTAGDISKARLVLKLAAEAGNADAALELGGTYDPAILKAQRNPSVGPQVGLVKSPVRVDAPTTDVSPDIAMARAWYERARDLGSSEAAGRLEKLTDRPRRTPAN